MSGVAHSSYSRRGIFCNASFERALDRLLGEAPAGQVAGRSGTGSPFRDDSLRAKELGLEGVEGSLDVLGSDAAPFQVVAYKEVATAALCEHLRTPPRKSLVVHRTCAHQPVDSFLPHRRTDVRAGQPVGQLSFGEVPTGERARGASDGLVQTELLPQPPRPRPVELDADVEACREHDLGRQGPPRLALELDLDSFARPSAQGANSWR